MMHIICALAQFPANSSFKVNNECLLLMSGASPEFVKWMVEVFLIQSDTEEDFTLEKQFKVRFSPLILSFEVKRAGLRS